MSIRGAWLTAVAGMVLPGLSLGGSATAADAAAAKPADAPAASTAKPAATAPAKPSSTEAKGVAANASPAFAPVVIRDPMVKAREVASASGLPDDVRKATIAIAAQEENRDRLRAVLALGEAGVRDAETLKVLQKAAHGGNVVLRASAVEALGSCDAGQAAAATTSLKEALKDSDASVRAAACNSVRALRAQDVLLPFSDPAVSVRLAAAQAAGAFLFPVSAKKEVQGKELTAAQKDKLAAAMNAAFDTESDDTVKVALLDAMCGAGLSAVKPAVRSGLMHKNPAMQEAALRVLVAVSAEDQKSAADFIGNAKNLTEAGKPVDVRSMAASFLSKVDKAWALANLPKWTTEAEPALRTTAARELGSVGDKTAVPVLEKLLADPEYGVRRTACACLVMLAQRKVLLEDDLAKLASVAAGDANINRAGSGLWILAELKSTAGYPSVLKYADVDLNVDHERNSLAALLLYGIGRSGYQAGGDAAIKCFTPDKADPLVRLQAVRAIRELRYAKALPILSKKLSASVVLEGMPAWQITGELRREILLTLMTINTPDAVEELLNALLSPRPTEEEENVALICQWLADNNAKVAIESVSNARNGKAFSDYTKSALVWTLGRLNGTETSTEAPTPPVPVNLPSFLSAVAK